MLPTFTSPAVEDWFGHRFAAPTDAQRRAWPEIQAGRDLLLSAPTGSGKTLAAFLVCIDELMAEAKRGELDDAIRVVYVSPLKALSSDIRRNLEEPLLGVADSAERLGEPRVEIKTALRTGDTHARARQEILRRPPHILITTPESLYLMLTAEKSRELLRGVRTVIVDEIHALLRDKRGSHLALSLARLDHVAGRRPRRIGLSATVHPVHLAARFLVGGDAPDPTVVQIDPRRDLDLAIEVPPTDLEAVCPHSQWNDIYDRLAELISEHRTTLVFVNTRARAERIAHHLESRVGAENVASHHGSLSKERRLTLEERLKAGALRALVATASLELGIDIGSVDLVCQIESPRSVSTFLQRIGRSGHALGRTPKGRLFPTTRDELVECVALLRAIGAGRLDRVHPPVAPLDILAQQVVAECAAETWGEDELFTLARRALPFAALSRADFDAVIDLLSTGIPVGMGRAAELLHRDLVHRRLTGRRSARRVAIESGGAIPDNADYRVLAEPDATFVGTVNEDFAIESQAGDIFLLGSTSWQIRKLEPGLLRVVDAQGAPPTIPFWLGEAPSRTAELSQEVSALRAAWEARGVAALSEEPASDALPPAAMEQIDRYFQATRAALGLLPTQHDLIYERFFDESGGMQFVVHAPFGGRINRAFGLALRKRFCRTFDFELQAAANDDAIVLSLGAHQSFPIESIFGLLRSESVGDVLAQAALASPMFGARWRWNATRALALVRQRHGKRVPPPIQRMRADDLMARVFPQHAACQENVTGPIELPDHPLTRQTMHDCLHEAMDLSGLVEVVRGIEVGRVRLHARDTAEPSPMAHEILTSKPWSYLDNAPLEERRARAVSLRRTLPEDARELGRLDPAAIARVIQEAAPELRTAEELHELLTNLLLLDLRTVDARGWGSREEWRSWCEQLRQDERAGRVVVSGEWHWFAAECFHAIRALWPEASIEAPRSWSTLSTLPAYEESTAAVALLRGYLDILGPATLSELSTITHLDAGQVAIGVAALEAEGAILRGRYRGDDEEVCDRALLARIHRLTLDQLRREIEPVSAQDYLRFLLRWQHVAPGAQATGKRGLLEVITQLQGFEAPARAWERHLLPSRVEGYQEHWLDELCLTGQVAWLRLSSPSGDPEAARSPASSITPITLARREDMDALLRDARGQGERVLPLLGLATEIHRLLEQRGALFLEDIARELRRLKTEVERALWELVARGLVTADGFQALRVLMKPEGHGGRATFEHRLRRLKRRGLAPTAVVPAGRWSLLPLATSASLEGTDPATFWADQLLRRYGVVFRAALEREQFSVEWREILRVLRRREARGEVRGGRFVLGFHGEQYALPEAIAALRAVRRQERKGESIELSAVDPLNLAGNLTPGAKIAAVSRRRVRFVDGLPSEVTPAERSSTDHR
ncbi:MAG: DEAD/DEAH box helicase [Candidatus Eisenbacteria bacterium]